MERDRCTEAYCIISQRSSLGSELYLATGMHTQLGHTLILSQDIPTTPTIVSSLFYIL